MIGKTNKSRFILIVAVSLDGRITQGTKEGTEWTSKEDQRFFRGELDRADVVILGRKTFDTIVRPLTPRNRIVFTRKKLFSNSQKFENKTGDCTTVAFSGFPEKLRSLLRRHDWRRVVIAGGTFVYEWFLKNKLVDEIYLTLEPVIFGSGKPFLASISTESDWILTSVKKLNKRGTMLLHYQVNK